MTKYTYSWKSSVWNKQQAQRKDKGIKNWHTEMNSSDISFYTFFPIDTGAVW